jgi:hypothetical protein
MLGHIRNSLETFARVLRWHLHVLLDLIEIKVLIFDRVWSHWCVSLSMSSCGVMRFLKKEESIPVESEL